MWVSRVFLWQRSKTSRIGCLVSLMCVQCTRVAVCICSHVVPLMSVNVVSGWRTLFSHVVFALVAIGLLWDDVNGVFYALRHCRLVLVVGL